MAEATGSAVKSATRTLDVLEFVVGQARPMPATEIAGALAIPMSSLSYLLSTLVERGYLARTGRAYAAGFALARLQAPAEAPSVAERAAPLVGMIARELNETASFFVRQGFEIEALVTQSSDQALRYTVSVGQRAPMHSFSAGKALLAAMPPDEFEVYLAAGGREAFTAGTLTDAAALSADINAIRTAGIARTREEHTLGIVGIGRAVRLDGVAAGAFSVAIPLPRHSPNIDAAAVRLLRIATERFERLCETDIVEGN